MSLFCDCGSVRCGYAVTFYAVAVLWLRCDCAVTTQDPPTWLAKLVDHWVRATATIRAKVQEQAQTQAQTQVQTQSRSSDGTHASSELSVSPVGSPLSATLNLGDRVTVEGYDENGIIRFIGDHARYSPVSI